MPGALTEGQESHIPMGICQHAATYSLCLSVEDSPEMSSCRDLFVLHRYLNQLNLERGCESIEGYWSLHLSEMLLVSSTHGSTGRYVLCPVPISASLAAACLCLFIFSSHHWIRAV